MIDGDVLVDIAGIPLILLVNVQPVAESGEIHNVSLLPVCNGPSIMTGTTMMNLSVWRSLKLRNWR